MDVERRPEQTSKQLRAQTPRAETPSAKSVGLPALLWFHTEDYANVQLYKRWLYGHWDTQYIMEFIPNCRGGRKLCFAGYMYNKKATKKTVIQWECNLRRGQNCRGLLTTTLAVSTLFVVNCFLELQLGHYCVCFNAYLFSCMVQMFAR